MREARLSPDAIPVAREIYRRAKLIPIGQKALAVRAGLGDTYVRDLYQARSKSPETEHLSKIAEQLGCTLDDLLHPERAEQPKDAERQAKTDEELAVLMAFRGGGERMQQEIVAAIERVALGALAGFRKGKDV